MHLIRPKCDKKASTLEKESQGIQNGRKLALKLKDLWTL
jgi:hypothetical protein